MVQTSHPPYIWIATDAALAAATRGWKGLPALGLDTEFVRERTFYHRLGLIQVSDGRANYLIDPLEVRDLGPFIEILQAPETVKVLHSASEDVEVFHRGLGALPAPLFDTQVAAALAGVGATLSYQKLVAALLGQEIPKGETRTDWLARPLSEAQLAYAAEDVEFLLPAYRELRRQLEELGRLGWALEDSATLLDTGRFEEDFDSAYLRIKGWGRFGRRQLGALQLLAAWREQEARRRDLPRNFVLRESLLLDLAARQPKTPKELQALPSFDADQAARDGAVWMDLLRQAAELAEDELPQLQDRVAFSPAVRELEQRLRDRVKERAQELGLPPEVLAPRRLLTSLLMSTLTHEEPRLPRELRGWRREVIGEDLLREAASAGGGLRRKEERDVPRSSDLGLES
jgi:ribonuclease D